MEAEAREAPAWGPLVRKEELVKRLMKQIEEDDEALYEVEHATERAAARARWEAQQEPQPEPAPDPPWPEDYSLMCFGPRNGLRVACQRLIAHPRFDQVIVCAIIASSTCLALDVPRLRTMRLEVHIGKGDGDDGGSRGGSKDDACHLLALVLARHTDPDGVSDEPVAAADWETKKPRTRVLPGTYS